MTIDQLETDAPPTSPASWRQFLIDASILLGATLVLVGAGYLTGWAIGFNLGTDRAASLVDAFVKMADSFDRGETGGVIGAIVGAICGVVLASWLILAEEGDVAGSDPPNDRSDQSSGPCVARPL